MEGGLRLSRYQGSNLGSNLVGINPHIFSKLGDPNRQEHMKKGKDIWLEWMICNIKVTMFSLHERALELMTIVTDVKTFDIRTEWLHHGTGTHKFYLTRHMRGWSQFGPKTIGIGKPGQTKPRIHSNHRVPHPRACPHSRLRPHGTLICLSSSEAVHDSSSNINGSVMAESTSRSVLDREVHGRQQRRVHTTSGSSQKTTQSYSH